MGAMHASPPRIELELARISHQISAAAADPGMSTALRFFGLLDVLLSRPAGPSVARRLAKRRIHARLRRLATKPSEKCGLADPEKYRYRCQDLNRLSVLNRWRVFPLFDGSNCSVVQKRMTFENCNVCNVPFLINYQLHDHRF
jgi:hypothetical protein